MAFKEKIVTARKNYSCDYCGGLLRENEKYMLLQKREPRYDDDDVQIGIEYLRFRVHLGQCEE